MSNVVLLSTRKLPPTYFDQVREDLGDQNITIDVVGWVAPSAWVADKVNSFTLIGPGRMPAAPVVEPEPDPATEPTDEAPDAVIAPEAVADPETVVEDEAKVAPAAAQVAAAASTPPPPPAAAKPRPTGAKRVVKAVEWRARKAKKVAGRMLPKAIKTSAPVKFLRGQRATSDLGKTYWERVLSRRDVLETIDQADVVIALDAGAIWAGWNLGQRKASTPVVLGLPAARRELDMMKAPST
ncbi:MULTISPECIES: hypothetical protein [Kribbella]|jgi:hypothetical protein|uniref:Uncharacterized protein n=1 Tax=Kribbella pratensis TaxID=2512112 RepID=A0ABY2FGA2_9ACTN|nr:MULTISPECIES: hypothetical protein [Kribbella]TDW90128.1 hypothetical protein EV137_3938 [Kribbella pratensis]TDW97853.1 hypothetical protein EV647_2545 [Kribbella sp. VKM Ac-2566]